MTIVEDLGGACFVFGRLGKFMRSIICVDCGMWLGVVLCDFCLA